MEARRATTIALVVGVLILPVSATAATAKPTVRSAPADLIQFVCDQLEGPATAGVKNIIRRLSSQRVDGGLAVDLVVKVAFTQCSTTVAKTVSFVRGIVRGYTQPRQPNRRAFDDLLDSISASTIYLQLDSSSIRSGSDVLQFAQSLCNAVRAGSDPNDALTRYVPSPRLSSITPLNGVVRLAGRRCSLDGTQMSSLTSAVAFYVLSHATTVDVRPPVVVVWEPEFGSLSADRRSWSARVSWFALDLEVDVARSELWIRAGATWHKIGVTIGESWNVRVPANVDIQVAVRSTDTNGNVSAWVFSKVYS